MPLMHRHCIELRCHLQACQKNASIVNTIHSNSQGAFFAQTFSQLRRLLLWNIVFFRKPCPRGLWALPAAFLIILPVITLLLVAPLQGVVKGSPYWTNPDTLARTAPRSILIDLESCAPSPHRFHVALCGPIVRPPSTGRLTPVR